MVSIDMIKCNGIKSCAANGVCITVCGLNAISNVDDKPVVNESCVDCGLCVMNCPREAIQLRT